MNSIGNFAEYVVDAKSDDNWVIAKTDNHISNQRKYYILNKKYNPNEMTVEDIINTRIECFTDSSEFAKKCLLWSPDKMVDGKSRVALVLITFRLK